MTEIHLIKPIDADYPVCMELVENKERYSLISLDGLILVPLVQVIDAISGIKADVIVKNGKKICPNCGAEMRKERDNESRDV